MNKRLLSRLMDERVHALQSSSGCFFRSDFKYVLTGVAFEYVPRGLYVWKFCFPLFDFFGLHLTYSDRLSGRAGFFGKNEMSENDILDIVMSSPEILNIFGADGPMEVSEFIRILESTPDMLRNKHARLTHAAALLLIGQEARAVGLLDNLVTVLNGKDAVNCNLLRTNLQQGIAHARALLDEVQRENLRMLGITGS